MQFPILPSFFKDSNIKKFSFKPRYYDERKERREKLQKGERGSIKFKRDHAKKQQKGRGIRIVFLIIILSLLAYKFIIN
ncbi:hypothetical protein OAK24_00075 [Flavobacteriales bacterium]|nr:hypothetical protein [Flavobacteriales bacterium]